MTSTFLTRRLVRLLLAALALAVTTTTTINAQPGARYEVVASFHGIFADGEIPNPLLQGKRWELLRANVEQRTFRRGHDFQVDAAGVLTTLHHFSRRNGSLPRDILQATDGNFYGTTEFGGTFNAGTIFRLDAAGGLTTLHISGEDGSHPWTLIQGSAGAIFGVTRGPAFNAHLRTPLLQRGR